MGLIKVINNTNKNKAIYIVKAEISDIACSDKMFYRDIDDGINIKSVDLQVKNSYYSIQTFNKSNTTKYIAGKNYWFKFFNEKFVLIEDKGNDGELAKCLMKILKGKDTLEIEYCGKDIEIDLC